MLNDSTKLTRPSSHFTYLGALLSPVTYWLLKDSPRPDYVVRNTTLLIILGLVVVAAILKSLRILDAARKDKRNNRPGILVIMDCSVFVVVGHALGFALLYFIFRVGRLV